MNEQETLVSIIVPTYNRAHLICETIQSVVDQTYPNWELIVVDDGSTDNTEEIVRNFSNERIYYYFIEHCGILGRVRNSGMQRAKGILIAFLDSDDLWLPNKLTYQLSLMKQDPSVLFVFGHGEQFGSGAISPPEVEAFFSGNVFLPVMIDGRFVFYAPSLIFKREVLHSIGNINENFISGGDIDFFLRMARQYKGIFSSKILVKIRKHDQNTSQKFSTVAYREHIQMIDKFYFEKSITRKQNILLSSKLYYKMGLLHMSQGDSMQAMGSFLEHLRLTPWNLKGLIRLLQTVLQALIKHDMKMIT